MKQDLIIHLLNLYKSWKYVNLGTQMINIYKLFLFFLLLSLTSCQIIHLLRTGERKDESDIEIKKYFDENKISSFDYSFKLIDSLLPLLSTNKHGLNTWKLERGGTASVVQLRIYKPNGALENAYAQCFGPFEKLNILDSYPSRSISHLPINYNLKFQDELDLWEINATTKKQLLSESKESSYTFVLYWNIWSNHFSKVVLREMEKYIKKHQGKDVKFLYVIVNNGREPIKI